MKTETLLTATFQELAVLIRDTVREKAQEIPKFRDEGNGAIRILVYPLCKAADVWMGGMGDFDKEGSPDIPDYEVTFAITSGGSRVIRGVWDGVEQKCDCYAYSAMKIAHCSRAQDVGAGLLSGLELNDPDLTDDNGYGAHRGALCVEVGVRDICGRLSEFCGIYVCVSGADSEDDLECAFTAVPKIEEFFRNKAEETVRFELRVPSEEEVEDA